MELKFFTTLFSLLRRFYDAFFTPMQALDKRAGRILRQNIPPNDIQASSEAESSAIRFKSIKRILRVDSLKMTGRK